MKQLLLMMLISSFCAAQYSPDDEQLVRETFLRNLEEGTVASYFYSLDENKTKALLLSLANTQNTDYVKIVSQLDLTKYGREVLFALGNMETELSRSFILNLILSNQKPKLLPEAFAALGNIATIKEYDLIAEAYGKLSKMNKTGISIFLTNLYMRKVIVPDSLSYSIIGRELKSSDGVRLTEALYASYRFGANADYTPRIIEIIQNNSDNPVLIQYAIANLRKSGFSEYNKNLFDKLQSHKDWRVRCELAGLLLNFVEQANILYPVANKLLNDSNPNVVARTLATLESVKNKKSPEFINLVSEQLKRNGLSKDIFGGLVNLYAVTEKEKPTQLLKKYQKEISAKEVYALIGKISDSDKVFNTLVDSLQNLDMRDTPYFVETLLGLQSGLNQRGDYLNMIFEFLASNDPAAAAMTAQAIDSTFAKEHKSKIVEVINSSIIKNYDNDDFAETFMIFADLSGKIDSASRVETLNRLTGVTIPSIKLFALNELGKETDRVLYSTDYFEEIWSNAFKYKSAIVKTNKGQIELNLFPEYAPVSVGNFVMLAQKGFYNNVVFHRVVPDFVIQAGDPTGTGWGGPGYAISSEFSPLSYERGTLGMASAGKDTEGSQWFITHSWFPHLDGRYSIFGKVSSGMEVVDRIERNNYITEIILK